MAVLQMQRISICALKKDRKAILEKLQSMGVMEISHVAEEDEDFQRMDTAQSRLSFEKASIIADQALDILQQYVPVKQSMLASLQGKDLIEEDQYQKVIDNKEELRRIARKIQSLDKEKGEQKANILKIENSIESLRPWMTLDVPMNYQGTARTAMLLGTMPAGMTVENVCAKLAERAPEVEAYDVQLISSDKDAAYVTVFCLKNEAKTVEEALRAEGFVRPAQASDKIPQDLKKDLEGEIEKLNARITEITKEVEEYAKYREDLRLFSDYYRLRSDKYEVLGKLPQLERTFVISGYVAQRDVATVQKAIGDRYDCVVDVEDIKEEEEAPVLLKNSTFSSSVEGVLESYGLPKKGEVDPTTVMSFFYVFLFGLMLSDAAYGIVMAVVCFIIIKKFPRMDKGLQKNIRMFMYCGISTMIWGILFGSYFGDVIDVVARTFFHVSIPEGGLVKALWFVPLNDPMRMLVYSMAFGLVHLFVGLGMKGYMLLKDKKVLDFLCDVVLWYVFLIGLLLMLIPSDIFASIAQLEPGSMPAVVGQTGKIMTIIGLVGIVLMSGRSSKNIFLRLGLGLYDVYNVTGWLSDVLSYSRLLALGLATGVIASVINQMGSMVGDGIFGAIIFIIVFIIGHTLNMAINLLGAYVHTNRLQFVEFFGKFYEGGGRAFAPFKSNTKYVEIKEESSL